ncbi:restriction endonuclease subunit S [Psychromonas sp. GE-S-Ul-11]|uniref:restriction endonuclease subunit S n=1 Tax=Psychromonas sp. GE-S-Ul-11 TaxID=3241170 RepID=UPI00390CA53D
MSNLATDWDIVPFQNVVDKVIDFRGRTPLKIGMDWGNGEILSLSANNVKRGYIDKEKEAHLGSIELYNKWMTRGECKLGDIVFTMEAPLGNVAQIPDNYKYILSQRVILLKINDKVANSTYIAYLMRGDDFQTRLFQRSTGSTVTGIQQQKLNKFELILPPIKQQNKIAKLLSTVDNLIDQTQNLIDKYTSVKKGMMADLFTRGIELSGTPETNQNYGQLRPSYEELPELYQETELGWIPKGWGVEPLCNCLNFLDRQRVPLKQEDRASMGGQYPYYGASGIIDYINDFIFEGSFILLGEDGENVLSRNLPLAFKVKGQIWVNNHAHIMTTKVGMDIDFYTEYLENINYENIVSGSAQPKITQSQLAKMLIKVPTGDEQKEVTKRLSSINFRIITEKEYLEKLKLKKKGLMQDLLTGKKQVN